MDENTAFALALQKMKGIGRVTAGKLLREFGTYTRLEGCPREQMLLRIRRTPNANSIVAALSDRAAMAERMRAAEHELRLLTSKGIAVLSPGGDGWPPALDHLPQASRPLLVYAYGQLQVLSAPMAGFYFGGAHGPKCARPLLQRLPAHGIAAALNLQEAELPEAHDGLTAVLVLPMGLSKAPGTKRPAMRRIVRARGLLLSPFAMNHGRYDHDEKERALVMAALSRVCFFVYPARDTSEWAAMVWASEAGRRVYAMGTIAGELPPDVREIDPIRDADRILEKARS